MLALNYFSEKRRYYDAKVFYTSISSTRILYKYFIHIYTRAQHVSIII